MDNYCLTKKEAQKMFNKITRDMDSPYWNNKAPKTERLRAIAFVNRLHEIITGKKVSLKGYSKESCSDSGITKIRRQKMKKKQQTPKRPSICKGESKNCYKSCEIINRCDCKETKTNKEV